MNYAERAVALSSALEADGYHMSIGEAEAKLSVVITAGPDACEDCLVPKDLMRGMLSNELGIDAALIDITYPADRPDHSGGAGH
jgi:hypothetical protein